MGQASSIGLEHTSGNLSLQRRSGQVLRNVERHPQPRGMAEIIDSAAV